MKKARSSANVCDEDICDELLTVTEESNGKVMASSSACKIMLGDKTTSEVLGIRTVKIKLQDGEVWSLSEVRFVLALRMNLLSLGSLDREGCSYKAKGGKLMVTQDCVTNNSSLRVLDFKGAESEVKKRDDGENISFEVELDTRAEEGGQQQQTYKGVLLEVEPSSIARIRPKESIKPSLDFGWMD
ncbi:hypothetical protein ACE6H2_010314 [Prunus campanulata]